VEAEAPRSRRKLAAILMVDVSGFSRLMARDEEWTTREIRAFHARVEARVHEFEGRVVDTAGDSVFGEFDSVVNATRCAQAIQADQAARNLTQPPDRRIDTRIGVHVGDVIVEEYKVYGDGVNIAARLEGLAEPGHILVSEAVFTQVRNKVPGEFQDGGMRALKNIDEPVHVYRLLPSALVPVAPRSGPRPEAAAEPPETPPAAYRPKTRREERLARRSRSRERSRPEPRPPRPRGLVEALTHPTVFVPLAVGVFLLFSPRFGLETGGVFPTAGAILVGLNLGRALEFMHGRRGAMLRGLGIGIMFGAQFTDWSRATDFMFLLGGGAVLAAGIARRRRRPELPPG
jgi:class 3 adenylate cyclase